MKNSKRLLLILASFILSMGSLWADHHGDKMASFIKKEVSYSLGDNQFISTIVYPKDLKGEVPGVLMVPNWMGPTEASLKKAKMVAKEGYVVMMIDMYGVDVRPSNSSEASAAAGTVRGDRSMMRERAKKAHEVLLSEEDLPLKKDAIAAIGFCFGGGTVLEYGRSGADLKAIVSFHGDLLSPTLEADAVNTKASVLVLHGADDPYVPQSDVEKWTEVMLQTKADWQLIQFSGTVHSFTDPLANSPGKADYNKRSADRAFEYMEELFEEVFELDD